MTRKKIYCKRCGCETKARFEIQLTPSKVLEVCTSCFNWSIDKPQKVIREDYAGRTRRRKNNV